MRLSNGWKGILLMLAFWALTFCVAAAILGMSNEGPGTSFDDCRGSPRVDDPNDRNGCTHGGLSK